MLVNTCTYISNIFCNVFSVVIGPNSESKGFGFVRFTSEAEQQLALIEMQNFKNLGKKPIKVSLAVPKK